MNLKRVRWGVVGLGTLGIAAVVVLHWMVFFWVPTESSMGIIQRNLLRPRARVVDHLPCVRDGRPM